MSKRNGAPEQVEMPTPIHGENIDHGLGEFFDQFPRPIKVGDLTVLEATEIKTRNKAIERLNADIDHLAKVRAIVVTEKTLYLRQIGIRLGMTNRDELNINDDTGDVLHVGTVRFVQPSEVSVTEVPPPPDDDQPVAPVN